MAFVNLSGILTNSIGGIDVGATLKMTHLSTTGDTLSSTITELMIPPDGAYDIDLNYGIVRFDYTTDFTQVFLAITTINADTTATTIAELLNSIVEPTSPQLLLFQDILADAQTAETNAAASAAAASADAATITAGGYVKREDITAPILGERDVRFQLLSASASLRHGQSDATPLDDPRNFFRGLNSPDSWGDFTNIGTGTTSFGRNGASFAYLGTTLGHDCITYGVASFAGGAGSATGNPDIPADGAAYGYSSFVYGKDSHAQGRISHAIGERCDALSDHSNAQGKECVAGPGLLTHPNEEGGAGIVSPGNYAIAFGRRSEAYGDEAISLGVAVTAYNGAQVFGSGINTGSPLVNSLKQSIAFGRNVDVPTILVREPAVVANGNYGRLGINNPLPTERIDALVNAGDVVGITLPTTSATSAKLALGGLVGGTRRDIFSIEWNHPNGGQPLGVTTISQNETLVATIDEAANVTMARGMEVSGIGYKVLGVRVVAGQQAFIPDAGVGQEIDRINRILALLKAHGLMAT